MGIKLIVEIMDWVADRLTATEWKAMVILAEDANDAKRLTWSSVNDPKITDRIGLSTEAWTNLRGVLVRKGVLEIAVPGKRGQVAKYRFPVYRPMGHETHEETPMGHEIDDLTAPMGHETDEESAERVMGSMTPTPPYSSPTSSSAPTDPPATGDTEGGGGGDQQQEAEAFLQSLPSPWTAGRKTARDLTPLLLERTAEQGWQLDADLTRWLARDLGPVRTTHATVLRARIDDLPKKPTAKTRASPDLPDWCTECGDDFPEQAQTNARFRTINGEPCKGCHPDHYKDAA